MANSTSYIEMVLAFIRNQHASGVDYREPFVRPSLRYVYPLFVVLHTAVAVVGVAGNTSMVIVIVRRGLYQNQTYFLMANLALSDLIKCVIVLPISLANLLIQNWQFGSFLCFFLPMMQCFPVHASMLTFLMIAIDRYRMIVHPFKSRLPPGLCIIGVWVAAVCVVLPYAIYIKYIDLESTLGAEFEGLGICYIFVERRIEEYIRAMFVTLYAMPLAVIALLYVRISAEFKSREAAAVSIRYAQNINHTDSEQDSSIRSTSTISWSPLPQPHALNHAATTGTPGTTGTTGTTAGQPSSQSGRQYNGRNSLSATTGSSSASSAGRLSPSSASASKSEAGSDVHHHHHHHHHHRHHHHGNAQNTGSTGTQSTSLLPRCSQGSESYPTNHAHKNYYHRPSQDAADEELDLTKEKRTQNYLITMTTQFAMCWCPFQILVLVNYFVHENDNNMGHYDITYILFAWFGFLSTCLTPILFASWRMSDEAKDRLRGYFRFSNRRRPSNSSQSRRRYPTRYGNESQSGLFEEHAMVMEARACNDHPGESV